MVKTVQKYKYNECNKKTANKQTQDFYIKICVPGAQKQSLQHRYIVWVKIIKNKLCQKSLGY